MTFHGEPHDQHHYEAAHESPLVMLVPLGVLAAGSIARRLCRSRSIFAGHHVAEFFRESLKQGGNDHRRHAPRAARGGAGCRP